MKIKLGVIKRRLPGGSIYSDLMQSIKEPYFRRFLRCLSVYCLGCRGFAWKNYPIGELREPYPKLYHFTPHTNVESSIALMHQKGRSESSHTER